VAVATGAKLICDFWPNDPKCKRVGKYGRDVDDLMRGPVKGGAVSSKARPTRFHTL
jgi:hypothetical protein